MNVRTGEWADFAGEQKGGDPISLCAAAFHRGDQGAAARDLGKTLGVYRNGEEVAGAKATARAEIWEPMIPPPADAPEPPLGLCDILHTYCDAAGRPTHYVRRLEARNGRRKQFIPLTYGRLNGKPGWHAKHPASPRPLYGLEKLATRPEAPVIVCEGEKAADAAAWLFPDRICITWPGGTGNVAHTDWTPLAHREVIIWPDNDQPGHKAAEEIAALLPQARILQVRDLGQGADAADVLPDDPETWLLERLTPASRSEERPLWFIEDQWSEAAIPKRPWIARGYALRGAVTVIVGSPGISKSTLAIRYSVSLAFGLEFNQLVPVRPCRVMYYNVEDSADEQRRRFSAVLRQVGRQPADLKDKVVIAGPNQVGTLVELNPDTRRVTYTGAMQALEERIAAFRPDMLILDPLVELHGGEENDNTALRAIMASFRTLAGRYDMAVVLLHHTRKGATGNAGDPDSSRGASSIIGAARIVLTVATMTEQDAEAFRIEPQNRRHYFRVDGAKLNYAPIEEAEWFERVEYELDNGDLVAALAPWTPPVDVVTPEIRAAIEAGIARGSPLGPWSAKLSGDPRSVKQLFIEHGVETQLGQRRLLQDLHSSGYVVAEFPPLQSSQGTGFSCPRWQAVQRSLAQ